MLDEKIIEIIDDLKDLVKSAYNEGFSEGMKEHTSSRGGNSWREASARKKLTAILEREIKPA